MTITPLRDPSRPGPPLINLGVLDLPTWDEPRPVTRWVTRLRGVTRMREIGILTVVALIGYIAAAYWSRYGLHFWINDALDRTDDAIYVTVGRDPHLGAIGFFWPPLPQLLQLPLVVLFRPLGTAIMAGPVSTAICMAATIPVLGQIGKRLRLARWTTFLICVTFAINPDIIYTSTNGMSEACFLLTGAISMLGFLTYIQTRSTKDLLIFTLGLSGAIMTRLEGPLLVFALVLVATFSIRHFRSSLWHFAIIIAPPYGCFAFWMLVQWILLKDPLFFLHQDVGANPAPGTAVWLPNTAGHPWAVVPWAMGWVLVLGPVLVLLVASLILRPLSGRTRGTVGTLAATASILVIQMYTVAQGGGFGDPRYFVMTILFATVGAMWLASNRDGIALGAWNLALTATLVVAGGTGSYALTSGRVTHIESECGFFQYGVARVLPVLGRDQVGRFRCGRPQDGLRAWQQADRWIDSNLREHDRILADNKGNFAASLFSTRPNLFIVRNDRDWQRIIANPTKVTYIMTQAATRTGRPSQTANDNVDAGVTLIDLDQPGWHLVRSFGGAFNQIHASTFVQVWHFVPSPTGGATPTGTESGLS